MDRKMEFKQQRANVLMKANNKISWVLRTFVSREKSIMRQLWRSMIQPVQDYASLIWAPVDSKTDLQAQEGPLRAFSRRVSGTDNLNYWQRLSLLKLQSIERRMERFRLIYTWKSLSGLVPSLGFTTWVHPRKGKLIYEKNSGSVQSIRTKHDKSLYFQGPKLFNSLPKCIRELDCTFDTFKIVLDTFLAMLPDRPCLTDYHNGNNDIHGVETNSIVHWIRNMDLYEWNIDISIDSTHEV